MQKANAQGIFQLDNNFSDVVFLVQGWASVDLATRQGYLTYDTKTGRTALTNGKSATQQYALGDLLGWEN